MDTSIVNVEGVPSHDSPIWTRIASWPRQIQQSNAVYTIDFLNWLPDGCVSVSDVGRLNTNVTYGALYRPPGIPSKGSGEHSFGPEFLWRPDGSLFTKLYSKGDGSFLFVQFYRNGKPIFMTLYSRSDDLDLYIAYEPDGTAVGYARRQFENTPGQSMKACYMWRNKAISEGEYFVKKREWRSSQCDK
jgi:hypothetical protein